VLTDDRCQIEDARLHEGKFTGVTRIDAELANLLSTGKGRRTSEDQRILVFNLGIALEDLATGVEILKRARQKKVGTLLPA
jgi:ornithine cyclodeaminase/alanine dehydrogenase-like protein (mu-crystallin family)